MASSRRSPASPISAARRWAGALLETIVAAHLCSVDPFDQPAVAEGKVLAKQYLARKG